jgi:hypothetical protein
MRSLSDLVASPEGRGFLGERGVFLDAAAFVAQLRPPRNQELATALGLDPALPLVYVRDHDLLARRPGAEVDQARPAAARGPRVAVRARRA